MIRKERWTRGAAGDEAPTGQRDSKAKPGLRNGSSGPLTFDETARTGGPRQSSSVPLRNRVASFEGTVLPGKKGELPI